MKIINSEKLFTNPKTSMGLTLLVMFFWGSLYPTVKIGYRAFGIDTAAWASILLFAGIRFIACGLVQIGIYAHKHRELKAPSRAALMPILLIAVIGYAMHYICTYLGISHLPSSKTAILKQVGTLFIICFAFLFRKEDAFSIRKLVGGFLGFASILIVNLNGTSIQFGFYDILIVTASFCSVISTVVSKNAYDHGEPLYITAWAQFIGGIILSAVGFIGKGTITRFGWDSVAVFSYMCFASCMGYMLGAKLLQHNNMSRINTIKFTETLFSALCSWVLLGENIFSFTYMLALILVCTGIYIGTGHKRVQTNNQLQN